MGIGSSMVYNGVTLKKEMRIMKWKFLLLSLMFLALTSCRLQRNAQLTETAQVTQISGAETLVASLSLTPQVTETMTPTAVPTATETSPPEFTPTMSPTRRPTSTSGSISSCDDARFVTDVTIPDGTEMDPGEGFTKTWRLENNGTCEWTTEYSVGFLSGNKMDGEGYQIRETVQSGETHDVSIEMVAPLEAGTYTGTWTIRNENGISFGTTFYVEIEVTSSATITPTPTQTLPASSTPTASPVPTSTTTPSPTLIPSPTITATEGES